MARVRRALHAVACIDGQCPALGCFLALLCDERLMRATRRCALGAQRGAGSGYCARAPDASICWTRARAPFLARAPPAAGERKQTPPARRARRTPFSRSRCRHPAARVASGRARARRRRPARGASACSSTASCLLGPRDALAILAVALEPTSGRPPAAARARAVVAYSLRRAGRRARGRRRAARARTRSRGCARAARGRRARAFGNASRSSTCVRDAGAALREPRRARRAPEQEEVKGGGRGGSVLVRAGGARARRRARAAARGPTRSPSVASLPPFSSRHTAAPPAGAFVELEGGLAHIKPPPPPFAARARARAVYARAHVLARAQPARARERPS